MNKMEIVTQILIKKIGQKRVDKLTDEFYDLDWHEDEFSAESIAENMIGHLENEEVE